MSDLPVAVVHADESCLGNGRDGRTPGGAASLIEVRSRGRIVRRDVYISSPDTTNNRMALSGAIATFSLLSAKGNRLRVIFVSDSEYLIKGMKEWVPAWQQRGWKRKGGAVENLDLWKALTHVASKHDPIWVWVRGHAGDPKNEYANDLAMRAAEQQIISPGAVPSGFLDWLAEKRRYGRFLDYDPDKAFEQLVATEAATR
ncbi:MAG: ribonuclease HI [Gemmatimonadales bacterium]|nr:Ribonuclease HI [bacterium HR33]GIW52107.1 MAG: ribonuclease HI [Gemmatimonadales bacterium]